MVQVQNIVAQTIVRDWSMYGVIGTSFLRLRWEISDWFMTNLDAAGMHRQNDELSRR